MMDRMPTSKPDKKVALGPLAEQVAANLRRIREEKRLTYAAISARLERLKRPIPVLGLRRIEKGERRVDVDDIAALAAALGVPPMLLIFPLGDATWVDILPDQPVATWLAVRWFIGDIPLPPLWEGKSPQPTARDDEAMKAWQTGARAIVMYREHDRLTGLWAAATLDAKGNLRMAEGAASDAAREKYLAEADAARKHAAAVERQIALHRFYMRRHGVNPEPLPVELANLDEDRIVYGEPIEGQAFRIRQVEDDPYDLPLDYMPPTDRD